MGQYDAQVYSYLTSQGLSPLAASAVEANLEQESGVNPNAVNKSSGAYGLAQWLGARKTALYNYASSRGLSPSSLQAQLGYLWQEISSGSEGVSPASLNAETNLAQATNDFSNKFERAGQSEKNNAARDADAATFYNEFSGKPPVNISNLTGLTQTSTGGTAAAAAAAPGANSFPTGSDPIQIIDKSLSLQNLAAPSAWIHPVQSVMQDAGAISLRVVLVIIGLILIIFALVVVVERSGVSTVPIPV